MRVLVCGGRFYDDRDHIHNTLCDIDARRGPISCIIHGAATGVDDEAMIWVQSHMARVVNIKHAPFAADWQNLTHPDALIRLRADGSRYDAKAGPRRNQRMIDEGKPDLVVAFLGNKGTADMVGRAKKAGIEVVHVGPRKP